jgi:hypothetical protein
MKHTGTKRSSKEVVVREEKVEAVHVELTLSELADLVAGMGISSTSERFGCGFVPKEHQTNSHAPGTYSQLAKIYEGLVEEGAYDNE